MKIQKMKTNALRNAELGDFLNTVITLAGNVNCEEVEKVKQFFINDANNYIASLKGVRNVKTVGDTLVLRAALISSVRACRVLIDTNISLGLFDNQILALLKDYFSQVDYASTRAQFTGSMSILLTNLETLTTQQIADAGMDTYIARVKSDYLAYDEALKLRAQAEVEIVPVNTSDLRPRALTSYCLFSNTVTALSEAGVDNGLSDFIKAVNNQVDKLKRYCLSGASTDTVQASDIQTDNKKVA